MQRIFNSCVHVITSTATFMTSTKRRRKEPWNYIGVSWRLKEGKEHWGGRVSGGREKWRGVWLEIRDKRCPAKNELHKGTVNHLTPYSRTLLQSSLYTTAILGREGDADTKGRLNPVFWNAYGRHLTHFLRPILWLVCAPKSAISHPRFRGLKRLSVGLRKHPLKHP